MCDSRIIAAAWQNFKPWLEQRLSDEVAKQPQLNNILHRQELNVCYLLNGDVSSSDVPKSTAWRSSGSGTLSLESLHLIELTGLSLETARVSGDTVILPLGFGTLSVVANYGLVQPCVEYSAFGTQLDRENYVSQGLIRQSLHDGRLEFHARFADNCELSFLLADVDGPPSVEVTPSDSQAGILGVLEKLFIGDSLASAIKDAAGNVFAAKEFSSELISLLNEQIRKLSQQSEDRAQTPAR
jgi:hypothetical protein